MRQSARYATGRLLTLLAYWPSIILASLAVPLCYFLLLRWGMTDTAGASLVNTAGSYQDFAATGLTIGIPATTAAGYGLWPVANGLSGSRRFLSAVQAPLSAQAIAVGEWMAVTARMSIQCLGYILIGLILNIWASSTCTAKIYVASLLTATCMYATFSAITLFVRNTPRYFFAINALIISPLMMLSGTWISTDLLPSPVQKILFFSPIWHATQWARGTTFNNHLVVLVTWSIAFLIISTVAMHHRLSDSSAHPVLFTKRSHLPKAIWPTPSKKQTTQTPSAGGPPSTRIATSAVSVWIRGMSAMSSGGTMALFPSSLVLCTCYLIIFYPALSDPHSGVTQTSLAAGLAALMVFSGSFSDCMDPLYARLHISRVYRAMMSYTPISAGTLLRGDISVAVTRALLYTSGAACLGISFLHISPQVISIWLIVATLSAICLGTICMAICTSVHTLSMLDTVRFILLPAFMFSSAIFPLGSIPTALRWCATLNPLWQIASLFRNCTLAQPNWTYICGATSYLLLITALSGLLAHRNLTHLS